MNELNQVILVNNDSHSNFINDKIIKESGLCSQVKITLNGGHALLYLDHISSKLDEDFKVLILLNMETPIADGFDFLHGYFKDSKRIKNKNNICIVVLSNNLSKEKMEKITHIGVPNFIASPLSIDNLKTIVHNYFNPTTVISGSPNKAVSETAIVSEPQKKKEKVKRSPRKGQSGLRVA
jgi:response regulator of citrate/malate metabolism